MYRAGLKERSPLASRETSPSRRVARETSPSRRPMRETSPSRRPMRETSPSRRVVRETSPSRRPMRETSPSRNHKWTPNWNGFPKPSAEMSKYDSEEEDDLSWIDERNGTNWNKKWTANSHGEKHHMSSSPTRSEKSRVAWRPTRYVPTTHCRNDSYEWSPCGERERHLHTHHEKLAHEHVDKTVLRDGRHFDAYTHRYGESVEAQLTHSKEAHAKEELHKAVKSYNELARRKGYKEISVDSLKGSH